MSKSFRDLIDMWPTKRLLALEMDVSPDTVRGWKARGAIPPHHWPRFVRHCAAYGLPCTQADLVIALQIAKWDKADADDEAEALA